MRSLLRKKESIKLLYVGSEHEFSAQRFHELCNEQGPTISICRSEHDCVFGFYTSAAWLTNGGSMQLDGRTFFFKVIDEEGLPASIV